MTTFDAIKNVAASGMAAQRLRVQLAATNIANVETTRTPEGGPYRKKEAVFQVLPMDSGADGLPVAGVCHWQVAGLTRPQPVGHWCPWSPRALRLRTRA